MENQAKQKAIEDVNYIKEIIEKTSSSMLTLSSLFLKCGMLFLVVSLVSILGSRIPVPYYETGGVGVLGTMLQVLSVFSLPAIIIFPILIFKKLVKNNPLKGVSKQIMLFWTFIISFILICFITLGLSKILLLLFNPFHVSTTDNHISYLLPIYLFMFAFGLLSINVFSKLRFPLFLGILYSCLGLYLLVLQVPWNVFNILLIPITFLIIGTYLKLLQVRVK